MDYNLRRKAIFITSLAVIVIIALVLLSNWTKLKNESNQTTVSAQVAETVVLVDETDINSGISYEKVGDDTSHWKKDETFFDNEKDTLAQRLMEEMSTLSIKVVSVENDIRVRVIDYAGNIKSGETFKIVATNDVTDKTLVLEDSDADGILYYDDIPAGNYSVHLEPIDGYIVPDDATDVSVPDHVNFSLIEDISLKIVSGDEIDKDKDETMVFTAASDTDKKLDSKIGRDENLIYGIDISEKNGDIDWNEVYRAGAKFAMIRAAFRGSDSGKIVIDSNFYENCKNAIYAGLDVGVYIESQAVNEVEAVEEASALLMLASEFRTSYPFTMRLDMAGGSGRADELSEEARTKVADAFCKTIRSLGKEACIYASKSWLDTNIDFSSLSRNRLWLAEYHVPPKYEEYYDMWQYSNNGNIPGIDGKVNLNISYNSYK